MARRGFEITQDIFTEIERDENLEVQRLTRVAKSVLPYGRALDDADLLLLLQEGFGGNRGAVLRRRLLARCFHEYRQAIVLSDREREQIVKYVMREAPGRDGQLMPYFGFGAAPVEPWGEIDIPWEQ